MRAVHWDVCWEHRSSCRPSQRPRPFRATSNVFVAEEHTLDDPTAQRIERVSNTASMPIEARTTGPLEKDRGRDRGRTSCYPSPAGFFPPRVRKGVAAEFNWSWPAWQDSTRPVRIAVELDGKTHNPSRIASVTETSGRPERRPSGSDA